MTAARVRLDAELVRRGLARSREQAGELVAAGLVTADAFENLRSLVDPKRRRGEGRARTSRPRHAAGRWALLHPQSGGELATSSEGKTEGFARQLLR